jgi:RimJ/RimL family protein N-acetyltransferase
MLDTIAAANIKVILSRFDESFISDRYISWLNNKDLMRYSRQSRTLHTKESCLAYLKSFESSPNHFFAVIDRDSGIHIGNITIYVDTITSVADIGIMIGERNLPGKGYGKEAWGLAMSYLFDKQSMAKVTAGTMACNMAMIKVAQHWHMQQEAQLRQQDLYMGQPVDILRFGILRSEWHALPYRPMLKDANL